MALHPSHLTGLLGDEGLRLIAAEGDEPKKDDKKPEEAKDKKDDAGADAAAGPAPEMVDVPLMPMGPKFSPGQPVRDVFSGREGVVAEPPIGDHGDIVFVTFDGETSPIREDQLEAVGGGMGAPADLGGPLGLAGPEGEPAPGSPIPGAPEASAAPQALPTVASLRRKRESVLKAAGATRPAQGNKKPLTTSEHYHGLGSDSVIHEHGAYERGHKHEPDPQGRASYKLDTPAWREGEGVQEQGHVGEARGRRWQASKKGGAGKGRPFVKAGGGAGIRFENFVVADGGQGVVKEDGHVEWKTLPTLAKFDAFGYQDGMANVRGDLLEVIALDIDTGGTPGEEFSLPSKFNISFVYGGGYTRSEPKAGDVIEPDHIMDQNDGFQCMAVAFKVTEDFVYFYQDVFGLYYPSDEDIAEFCEANDRPLPENERESQAISIEMQEMHDEDARMNWGASAKGKPMKVQAGVVTAKSDPRRLTYDGFKARLVAEKVTTHAGALAIIGYLPEGWDAVVARLAKDGVKLTSPKASYDVQALMKKGYDAQEVRFVLAGHGVPVASVDAVLKLMAGKPTTPPPAEPAPAGKVWAWDETKGGWFAADAAPAGQAPKVAAAKVKAVNEKATDALARAVKNHMDPIPDDAPSLTVNPTKDSLVFTANEALRAELKGKSEREAWLIILDFMDEDLEELRPEEVGALTDAPIIGYGVERDDRGDFTGAEWVYWFPNYAIESPWETLAETGEVVFTGANEDVEAKLKVKAEEDGDDDPEAAAGRDEVEEDAASDVDREAMTSHYLVTALWSSTDNSDPETGGEPLDANYDVDDFTAEAQHQAEEDCAAFIEQAKAILAKVEDIDFTQVGHDFWLTRNGHGAGFWDRPEMYGGQENADALTDIAHGFGEVNIEVGDDGKLHFYP